ncbi:MAG: precorrin-6y C5,15-methyltransferase (decarboxylating) subunit CbiE [Alphaproteobacteria bacterium]|nr:MAG: precorrin-6y C5,15-methyltransferase (decarboxylating) subunit CbiE [Alphaproteobacteria bacterium]
MSGPWLQVIGIGEDGLEGLRPAARAALAAAEVVLGARRHHEKLGPLEAERIEWPSPFDALIGRLRAMRGRRVAVLATGDPLWYSVGAKLARAFGPDEIAFHPQISAFQWVACRLGWSLADLETLTAHGRPVEQIIPFVQPGARLIVLTTGAGTPAEIARLLTERGYGASRMIAFGHLGGPDETRHEGTAADWSAEVPEFNTLAVECVAGPDALVAGQMPGLPDALYAHDGQLTKAEVRALTLARLMPMRGALLWDIGAGCGSVGIEWMRAARDARAIAIEPDPDRRALAAANAARLGAPRLEIVAGRAPEALAALPPPDAVFVGGGLSEAVIETAAAALRPLGRLVANAVTLESEALLARTQQRLGGELVRLAVARAEPLGARSGWRPLRPVVQWSWIKR